VQSAALAAAAAAASTDMSTEPAYRATRKGLSMPAVCLDSVNIVTAESSKSFSARKTLFHKEQAAAAAVQSSSGTTISAAAAAQLTCIGVLVFTAVIFFLVFHAREDSTSWRLVSADEPSHHARQARRQFVLRMPQRPWSALQTSSERAAATTAYSNDRDLRPGWKQLRDDGKLQEREEQEQEAALEGMGTLFRRGKRSMTELLVAHLAENTSTHDLRLFLRTLHRSGMTARADVVLLFPWRPLPMAMLDVIHEEEQSFHKLLHYFRPSPARLRSISDHVGAAAPTLFDQSSRAHNHAPGMMSSTLDIDNPVGAAIPASFANISVFNAAAFWKMAASEDQSSRSGTQNIWGSSSRIRYPAAAEEDDLKVLREDGQDGYSATYGSIVGFDMQELDPADAMRAFINEPPAELRRWVCYQILLGILRQKYRHVMLSEVRGLLVLKDILAPLKKKDTGLYLFAQERRWSDAAAAAAADHIADQTISESIDTAAAVNVAMEELHEEEQGQELVGTDHWELQLDQEHAAAAGKLISNQKRISAIMDLELDAAAARRRLEQQQQQQQQQAGHLAGQLGLIQHVYGKEVWESLEREEKRRRVLSSGVITGGIRSVRTLASAMATEIVRVAMLRKSRHPFKDDAILSFLIHKSSVLGRKVSFHLHIQQHLQQHTAGSLQDSSSAVNLLSGSALNPVATTNDFFFTPNGFRFAVIQGYQDQAVSEERRNKILASLHKDICLDSVTADSRALLYTDCGAAAAAHDQTGVHSLRL